MSRYAEALRSNFWKTAHDIIIETPLNLTLGPLQSDQYHFPGKPRLDPTAVRYVPQHPLTPVLLRSLKPLTVDCGVFNSEGVHDWSCCTGGILWRYHAGIHSWERPSLSHMLIEAVWMPTCLILFTCGFETSARHKQIVGFGRLSEWFCQWSANNCSLNVYMYEVVV